MTSHVCSGRASRRISLERFKEVARASVDAHRGPSRVRGRRVRRISPRKALAHDDASRARTVESGAGAGETRASSTSSRRRVTSPPPQWSGQMGSAAVWICSYAPYLASGGRGPTAEGMLTLPVDSHQMHLFTHPNGVRLASAPRAAHLSPGARLQVGDYALQVVLLAPHGDGNPAYDAAFAHPGGSIPRRTLGREEEASWEEALLSWFGLGEEDRNPPPRPDYPSAPVDAYPPARTGSPGARTRASRAARVRLGRRGLERRDRDEGDGDEGDDEEARRDSGRGGGARRSARDSRRWRRPPPSERFAAAATTAPSMVRGGTGRDGPRSRMDETGRVPCTMACRRRRVYAIASPIGSRRRRTRRPSRRSVARGSTRRHVRCRRRRRRPRRARRAVVRASRDSGDSRPAVSRASVAGTVAASVVPSTGSRETRTVRDGRVRYPGVGQGGDDATQSRQRLGERRGRRPVRVEGRVDVSSRVDDGACEATEIPERRRG